MRIQTASIFLFLFCCFGSFAGEITLKGNYFGYNLYVLNPSTSSGFCVTQVLVNNIATNDELNSNSFEIDFSQLNLKIGDPVTIIIKHKDECTPVVVNPKALQPSEDVSFTFIKFDKNGNLTWGIKGNLTDENFFVEQYKWNKWLKIAEISPTDTARKNIYSVDVNLHTGYNQFRVFFNDENGNPVYSKTVKTFSKKPEITLESSKVTDKVVFSAETYFEIFDLKGNFILEGFGKEIDITDLEKGKYWLNYDNKSVNIIKK